ncbi:MAG: ribonuclease III, partial [Clostridiales bacterium]|nr:ribonuclease III [Clostridiales bacterium]
GFILLGRGEEHTGGRQRPSVLSDAFEAIIGSIYLDGGIDEARRFVCGIMRDQFRGHGSEAFVDYKTQLQELIQKRNERKVTYELLEQTGPDHEKRFMVQVNSGDEILGKGEGRSKKEAEQRAAQLAMLKLNGK